MCQPMTQCFYQKHTHWNTMPWSMTRDTIAANKRRWRNVLTHFYRFQINSPEKQRFLNTCSGLWCLPFPACAFITRHIFTGIYKLHNVIRCTNIVTLMKFYIISSLVMQLYVTCIVSAKYCYDYIKIKTTTFLRWTSKQSSGIVVLRYTCSNILLCAWCVENCSAYFCSESKCCVCKGGSRIRS